MMTILSIKSKTMRELAEKLGYRIYYKVPNIPLGNVIRWGNTEYCNANMIINKAKYISRASDKAFCRRLLLEADIPVPAAGVDLMPCVGRKARHNGGKGFFFCHNMEDVRMARRRGATYFSQYYPKQDEYRVHIAGGKCLLMSEKLGNKNKHIWNKNKNGFTFRHLKRSEWLDDEYLMDMVRLAKRAVAVLNLDFGAVDILANPTDTALPEMVVCEINTAPALSPLAMSKYIQYFQAIEEEVEDE